MALKPLSRTEDYEFPEKAWDVRGWTVRAEAGDDKVGRVDDMLLDSSGALRYLDVDLGFLKKHILVPLDHAHADREHEVVWIEGLTRKELESVPEYALDPDTMDEAYERRIDAVYGGTTASVHRGVVAPEEDPDGALDLQRMKALEDEFRVAGDDPRGWTVVTGEGEPVGEVAELLMEPGAMKARFMDVIIDEKKLDLERVDRHVLLPVDRVRLDRGSKNVVVSGLLAHDFADYPQYGGLPVTRKAARRLGEVFDRVGRGEPARRDRDRSAPADAPTRGSDWRETTLHHFYRARKRDGDRREEEARDD